MQLQHPLRPQDPHSPAILTVERARSKWSCEKQLEVQVSTSDDPRKLPTILSQLNQCNNRVISIRLASLSPKLQNVRDAVTDDHVEVFYGFKSA